MSFIKPENAAQVYVTQMQNRFQELADQLQEYAHQVDDAQAKELFDKSASVLSGLINVFADYAQNSEVAGQDQQTETVQSANSLYPQSNIDRYPLT